MSRIIHFSQTYPSYIKHLKGKNTDFVAKILAGLNNLNIDTSTLIKLNPKCRLRDIEDFSASIQSSYNREICKYTTIRSGNRWKEGDTFSPRVWAGRPYFCPVDEKGNKLPAEYIIAPDLIIQKVWKFEIRNNHIYIDGKIVNFTTIECAINDGLTYDDMLAWFKFPNEFNGQIICWNKNIEY